MPVSTMAIRTQPRGRARAHRDAAALGRELHRVGEEVEHDLLEQALVGLHADALARCRR